MTLLDIYLAISLIMLSVMAGLRWSGRALFVVPVRIAVFVGLAIGALIAIDRLGISVGP